MKNIPTLIAAALLLAACKQQSPVPLSEPVQAETAPAASVEAPAAVCPYEANPFSLQQSIGVDYVVPCGLRSERNYQTAAGIPRYQVTYEFMASTAEEELGSIARAMVSAGFREIVARGQSQLQKSFEKQPYGEVHVWANPERKPDFKNPTANGAIGIDLPAPDANAPVQ